MLGSTKSLLATARAYFDELGYNFHTTDDSLDFEKLFDSMVYTINHTKEFSDTREAIKMFRFLDSKFEKIIDAVYKYPDYFDSLEYGKNEVLSLVDDEESIGVFNITNAIYDNWSDITIFNVIFKGPCNLCYENSKFFVYKDDSSYFLRYSHLSKEKMVLLDKNDEKICVIKLNNNLEPELNNNYTNYEIDVVNGLIFFYQKGEKEKSEDNFDAMMEWDIIEKNSKLGLVRLEIYNEEADEEILFLIASSCLLLYRGIVETTRTSHAGLIASLNAAHIMFRH